ncbi:gephyrin-like molybdotransferase Glp [Aquabacterium sp. J223]|uniref:molybdopterin molybdotransferase MoeA n=1 Tax=Aquabacterium sp. J223 TaxID=2898431 RepID=UPI0021AD5DFD|nr:gephyrin-like molybdotransferase Glp [Aquabacterium sp. J223]UUX93946.1 molybdopterin molybdotransferase MoeA [Aquabacterium sp. J223]
MPSAADPKAARPPLLTLDDALAQLAAGAAAARLAETETLSTFDALGRVLAAPVTSTIDVPQHDNSAMDGYALRAADVPVAGTVLPVSQRIAAGGVGATLQPGTAARIFTGAPLPAGADAVVMQEQCTALDGGQVRIDTVPTAGLAVRRAGEDVPRGAEVLAAGRRLNPQALGVAAAVGTARLTVLRRPRVALFSTGDELVMPGQPLPPGAIYNSNRFLLRGLLQAAGCEVQDLGIVPDDLGATRAALREAAAGNDLIVSSGGVSVGEEDHLKPAVQAEGELSLWSIAIKPGKPLAFGRVRRGEGAGGAGGQALFLGLPGNPVSSFITFVLAGRVLLHALQGMDPALPRGLPLRADFDWPKPDPKRREFLRVSLNAAGGLDLFGRQGSGVLTSTVWADGLVDLPAGTAVRRGDTVVYLPLSQLLG